MLTEPVPQIIKISRQQDNFLVSKKDGKPLKEELPLIPELLGTPKSSARFYRNGSIITMIEENKEPRFFQYVSIDPEYTAWYPEEDEQSDFNYYGNTVPIGTGSQSRVKTVIELNKPYHDPSTGQLIFKPIDSKAAPSLQLVMRITTIKAKDHKSLTKAVSKFINAEKTVNQDYSVDTDRKSSIIYNVGKVKEERHWFKKKFTQKIYTLMPYQGLDLTTFILNSPKYNIPPQKLDQSIDILRDFLKLGLAIMQAIQEYHKKTKKIHGDIKERNLLLTIDRQGNFKVKIIDCTGSIPINTDYDGIVWTPGYVNPEYQKNRKEKKPTMAKESQDYFSLGKTLDNIANKMINPAIFTKIPKDKLNYIKEKIQFIEKINKTLMDEDPKKRDLSKAIEGYTKTLDSISPIKLKSSEEPSERKSEETLAVPHPHTEKKGISVASSESYTKTEEKKASFISTHSVSGDSFQASRSDSDVETASPPSDSIRLINIVLLINIIRLHHQIQALQSSMFLCFYEVTIRRTQQKIADCSKLSKKMQKLRGKDLRKNMQSLPSLNSGFFNKTRDQLINVAQIISSRRLQGSICQKEHELRSLLLYQSTSTLLKEYKLSENLQKTAEKYAVSQ